MNGGIVVVFPGTGYTCFEKLLVACVETYTSRGYDSVKLDFSGIAFQEIPTIEEAFERTKDTLLAQLGGTDFSQYRDIVFVSKSFGTICAGWLEERLGIQPRQLYLTPVNQTLSYIKPASRVIGMVVGTSDRHMDYRFLEAFCSERRIPCLVFDGVGHSLKLDDDADKTNAINNRILELCSDS